MKQVQKKSVISFELSDQFWWYNIKQFFSCSKNCAGKFMQANSWYYKLIHIHLSLWKFGKEGEKLQKFESLENKKSFFDEIKNIFMVF